MDLVRDLQNPFSAGQFRYHLSDSFPYPFGDFFDAFFDAPKQTAEKPSSEGSVVLIYGSIVTESEHAVINASRVLDILIVLGSQFQHRRSRDTLCIGHDLDRRKVHRVAGYYPHLRGKVPKTLEPHGFPIVRHSV